jgi:hypothetical protein
MSFPRGLPARPFPDAGRTPPASAGPILAVGRRFIVVVRENGPRSVVLTDGDGTRTVATLKPGAEVEIVAWKPSRARVTRYRVRATAGDGEGWLVAASLQPAVPPRPRPQLPAAPPPAKPARPARAPAALPAGAVAKRAGVPAAATTGVKRTGIPAAAATGVKRTGLPAATTTGVKRTGLPAATTTGVKRTGLPAAAATTVKRAAPAKAKARRKRVQPGKRR